MYSFLSGGIAMSCLTIAFFFIRFYRKVGDRLFLFFALAFLGLSLERVVLVMARLQNEESPLIYIMRLCAFLIIIAAILDKNLRSGKIEPKV
jgi:hypothetical protein